MTYDPSSLQPPFKKWLSGTMQPKMPLELSTPQMTVTFHPQAQGSGFRVFGLLELRVH